MMNENDFLVDNNEQTAANKPREVVGEVENSIQAAVAADENVEEGADAVFHLDDVLNEDAVQRLLQEKQQPAKKTKKTKKITRLEKIDTLVLTFANIIALAVFIFLLPYFALKYIDDYSLHDQYIEVPDINTKTIDEGKKIFNKQGLQFEIVGYEYTDTVPSNRVIKQEPAAHSKVKLGRVIKVVLSTKEKPVKTIPDVVDNCSRRQAEDRLVAAGFVVTTPVYKDGEEDWVYGLLYEGDSLSNGNKIPVGATVTLVVGKSKKEEEPAGGFGLDIDEDGEESYY